MTNVHVLLNALNLISMQNTIRVSGTLYIYTLSLYVLVWDAINYKDLWNL